MSYLQDRKSRNKRNLRVFLFVLVLALLFIFQGPIFSALSFVAGKIFRPVLVAGNSAGSGFSSFFSSWRAKQSLLADNVNLKEQLNEALVKNASYDVLLDENNKLKEILGRKDNSVMILGNILAKPNQSLYDTLIIDAGSLSGIEIGDTVFALGDIPIGKISEVFESTSKATLFSSWKEKTEVIVSGSDVFMDVVGRGGGNFEMLLPRDFEVEVGQKVVLPGARAHVLGTIVSVLSDPRDSYKKALLISPVNIQQIKFVQVKK